MNKPIIILMDDVHLEGREENEQIAFANEINTRISEVKMSGDIPIVVCAGDIGEGAKGISWALQFDADIIYVCGNHEFWNQDFYKVENSIREKITNSGKKNVYFLYNNTIDIYGIRFIGTTLWTSMADFLPWYSKNHIIKYYAAMGDFKRIKAEQWYSSQNETRLKNFLTYHGVEEERINDLITAKYFNPLLQSEENHKAIDFLLEELSKPFEGNKVVISHHLPVYELWMKEKKIIEEHIQGEFVNNERQFYEAAKGNDGAYKNVLMMGYYANDLKEIMYSEEAPDYWFHGHLHQEISEVCGRTKIISSPVGYKKQSSQIKYKLIDLENHKVWLSNYVKHQIESYDWNNNLLSTLHDLEKTINKFQLSVSLGMLSSYDFEATLKVFQQRHADNLKKLKKDIANWLKLFIYDKNPKITDPNIDFYIVSKLSGILDMKFSINGKDDIKYKFPELLAAAINENSFIDEKIYNEKNKNGILYYHYKEWLKELQKIQIQIGQYKKMLLEYCEQYKK